jgi:hypothetical protein
MQGGSINPKPGGSITRNHAVISLTPQKTQRQAVFTRSLSEQLRAGVEAYECSFGEHFSVHGLQQLRPARSVQIG